MNKVGLIAAAALVVVLVAITVALASNPLRSSDEAVQAWLLEAVPIGSSIDDLERIAQLRGWRINSKWDGGTPHSNWGGVEGDKVVWIYLGGYRNIFRTYGLPSGPAKAGANFAALRSGVRICPVSLLRGHPVSTI